jgi:Tfp pilus assembly protein PilV
LRRISLKGKKGFTLIEAFSGSAIFIVSLCAIGLATYTEFAFINQNREKALATMAAQEYVERIRAMAFDDILAITSSWASNTANIPSAFTYLSNPQGAVTVDNIYGTDNIRRVSVTVSWDSLSGGSKSRRLVTLMSRNGINKQ